jgi:hypothetical protein
VTAVTLLDWAAWATIAALVAGFVFFIISQAQRHRDRTQRVAERTEQQGREDAAAQAEQQQVLDSTRLAFTAEARPPAGNSGRPPVAPLYLYAHGDKPVWIHDVRLTWGERQEGAEPEQAGLMCAPWDGDKMPVPLQPDNRGLPLDWPAMRPPVPQPISWELEVTWSAERPGPTATTTVRGGSTNWQQL